MTDPYTPTTEEVRFWSKVEKGDSCWLWTARLFWDGYGNFSVQGKSVRAHRWSYELAKGPIGEGLVIDHLCRVRNCVNPDHLEAVTNRENLLRGEGSASRTHCPAGHPYDGENLEIRPSDGHRRCKECRKVAGQAYRDAGRDKTICPHCQQLRARINDHIRRMHPSRLTPTESEKEKNTNG